MSRNNILSLPAELRLQIGEYIFEEPQDLTPIHLFNSIAGAKGEDYYPADADWRHGMWLNEKYSTNLSVLLVCRRFRDEFTDLAHQKTRFLLLEDPAEKIARIPIDKVRQIRRLAIACDWSVVSKWSSYPFNNNNMQLDELTITFNDNSYDPRMVQDLRRLKNIKMLQFVRNENYHAKSCQIICYKLIGSVLQQDHWSKYDAPQAPMLQVTWWDWQFDPEGFGVTLFTRNPQPILPEKEYLAMMQPRIDEVIAGMVSASS